MSSRMRKEVKKRCKDRVSLWWIIPVVPKFSKFLKLKKPEMCTACECFSTACDGKNGIGPGCSVLLRSTVSDSSVTGAEAEGDIKLMNTGENSSLILCRTASKEEKRKSFMAGICSRCSTKGKWWLDWMIRGPLGCLNNPETFCGKMCSEKKALSKFLKF